MLELIAKLHGSEKSMIFNSLESPGNAWPHHTNGGLPSRAGEEGWSQESQKGRFYAPKSFAISSLERTGAIHALNIASSQFAQGARSKALFDLRSTSSLSSESAPSCFWNCFIQPFISLFRFLFCCCCYDKAEESEEESEEETDSTEERKIDFHANADEKDECPICITEYTLPIEVKCGHVFDRQCYIQWPIECSVCRKPISNSKIIERPDIMKNTREEKPIQLVIKNLSQSMKLIAYPSTPVDALKQIAYHHFFQKDKPLKDTMDLLRKYVFKHKDTYLVAEKFLPLEETDGFEEQKLPLSYYNLKGGDELTLLLKMDTNGMIVSCDPCFVEKTPCEHLPKEEEQ